MQGDVPGDGTDVLADFRQVTDNHVQATVDLAADVEAGERPRPDFVLWPENSTAVDPFRRRADPDRHRRPRPRRSAYRSWSAPWSTPAPTT